MSLLSAGTLLDCYDELGNRYQLPVYVLSMPTNLVDETSEGDTEQAPDDLSPIHSVALEEQEPGVELPIKFRLAPDNKDFKMTVQSNDLVLKVKRQLQEMAQVEVGRQRWFFGGRLITDKMTMEASKITKGCLIQVVVSEAVEGRI